MHNKPHSDRTKRKISESLKISKAFRKHVESLKGKKFSKEHKENLSKAHKKLSQSTEYREKLSLACLEWHRKNPHPRLGKFHSEEAKEKMGKNHADVSGEKSPRWTGGKNLTCQGYYRIWNGIGQPRALEHRVIAEGALGRKLKPNEIVHHINGDGSDNRNKNLLICDKSYHNWLHWKMADLYMKEHFESVR